MAAMVQLHAVVMHSSSKRYAISNWMAADMCGGLPLLMCGRGQQVHYYSTIYPGDALAHEAVWVILRVYSPKNL